MSVEWARFLPLLVAGVAMLALAAWLLYLDHTKLANKVFAALLVVRGGTFFIGAATNLVDTEHWLTWFELGPYLTIPLVSLTIYFLSVHPRKRGPFSTPAGGLALAGVTAACLAWYALDHTAVATLVPFEPGSPHGIPAGGGYAYAGFGPLILFVGLRLPILALAAVVFALDYVNKPLGSARHSAMLLHTGFALNAYFDGGNALIFAIEDFQSGGDLHLWPFGWIFEFAPIITLLIAFVSSGILVRNQFRGEVRSRHGVRRLLYAAVFSLAAGILAAGGISWGLPGASAYRSVSIGIFRLVLPLLATYALVRYSLFDMDIKVKAGVGKGTVVTSFVVLLVVTSELIETFVEAARGPVMGIAAAAALTLLFRPVEGLGERIAHRLLPDVKPIHDQSMEERERFYREHLNLAREDGHLAQKELDLLHVLAERLGLTAEQIARIEAE